MYNTVALKLPDNYVLMDMEEMTYVDGGGVGQAVAYYTVKYGINVAINAALGGGTIGLVRGLVGTAKEELKAAIKRAILKWASVRVANFVVGSVFGAILDVGLGSVGGVVANWLDKKDGAADKQIYFSRIL